MQWNKERSAGAAALALAIGVFLTAAAPMAAAQLDPPDESPAEAAEPIGTAEPAESLPVPTQTVRTNLPAAAPVPAAPVQFVVQTPELVPGTALTLSNANGEGGTFCAPDSGRTTLTLTPGRWTILADGLPASFTLRENASITDAEGACWTDGERLTLSSLPHGTLSVCKTFPAQQQAAFVYRLVGGDVENDCRILLFAPDTDTTQTCSFWGIPEGRYTLLENDLPVMSFSVTDSDRSHSLSLF